MPNLVGQTLGDARAIVEDNGWRLGDPLERTDAESRDRLLDIEASDDWVVISQLPDPGDPTSKATSVTVSVVAPEATPSPSPSPSELPSTTAASAGVATLTATWAATGEATSILTQAQLMAEDIDNFFATGDSVYVFGAGGYAVAISAQIDTIVRENPNIEGKAEASAFADALENFTNAADNYDDESISGEPSSAATQALSDAMGLPADTGDAFLPYLD